MLRKRAFSDKFSLGGRTLLHLLGSRNLQVVRQSCRTCLLLHCGLGAGSLNPATSWLPLSPEVGLDQPGGDRITLRLQ